MLTINDIRQRYDTLKKDRRVKNVRAIVHKEIIAFLQTPEGREEHRRSVQRHHSPRVIADLLMQDTVDAWDKEDEERESGA